MKETLSGWPFSSYGGLRDLRMCPFTLTSIIYVYSVNYKPNIMWKSVTIRLEKVRLNICLFVPSKYSVHNPSVHAFLSALSVSFCSCFHKCYTCYALHMVWWTCLFNQSNDRVVFIESAWQLFHCLYVLREIAHV